ncbi:hypothetical protein UFJFPfSW6_00010 [Pseudomonas phage UFJF_PfSW6]|uniref:Uncharacterized protein n=1 Tax=Pseudomonas phage UFJF_PfSW6 TaxID=3003725 RepID=A0A9Y1MTD4_9CAUD|nr:hypothetical protein UFJFPfSW6_00010 [Pseudomonas phage UFJF_PfSW6]
MKSVCELQEKIKKDHPQARLQVWREIASHSWSLQVMYNATTAVEVRGIHYDDLTEDFLCDDLLPAIKWLRTGGQFVSVSYDKAKATTKHLNETTQAIKEISQ